MKIIKDVAVQGGRYVYVGGAAESLFFVSPYKKGSAFKELFRQAASSRERAVLKAEIENASSQIFHFETAAQLETVFEDPVVVYGGERWKLRLKTDCALGKKGEVFVIKRDGKERILKELLITNEVNKIDFSEERKIIDFDLIKAQGIIEDSALREYMKGEGFGKVDTYAENLGLLTKGVRMRGLAAADIVILAPFLPPEKLPYFYALAADPITGREMDAWESILLKINKKDIAHKDTIGGPNLSFERIKGRMYFGLIDFGSSKFPHGGDMQDFKDFERFKEKCKQYGIYVP